MTSFMRPSRVVASSVERPPSDELVLPRDDVRAPAKLAESEQRELGAVAADGPPFREPVPRAAAKRGEPARPLARSRRVGLLGVERMPEARELLAREEALDEPAVVRVAEREAGEQDEVGGADRRDRRRSITVSSSACRS